jgi:hypothetical protein
MGGGLVEDKVRKNQAASRAGASPSCSRLFITAAKTNPSRHSAVMSWGSLQLD